MTVNWVVCTALCQHNFCLANAYRQLCTNGGNAIIWSVDTSYRHVKEDHSILPILAVNASQSGRLIACAVCSNEDEEAHKVIFRNVKREIEKLINDLVKDGYTHV